MADGQAPRRNRPVGLTRAMAVVDSTCRRDSGAAARQMFRAHLAFGCAEAASTRLARGLSPPLRDVQEGVDVLLVVEHGRADTDLGVVLPEGQPDIRVRELILEYRAVRTVVEGNDGGLIAGRREDLEALLGQAAVQTVRQGHRVLLDPVRSHVQQVVQRSGKLVDRREGGRGVAEFPGIGVNRVLVVGQPFIHHSPSQAVGLHHVHHRFPNVEGRHAEAAEEPLVRARGEEIDSGRTDVEIDHAHALHGVGIQVGAVGVRQVRQRLQILAVTVPVGYPRHGDQLRPVVHHLGEGIR